MPFIAFHILALRFGLRPYQYYPSQICLKVDRQAHLSLADVYRHNLSRCGYRNPD
jgi:hypothetical protein